LREPGRRRFLPGGHTICEVEAYEYESDEVDDDEAVALAETDAYFIAAANPTVVLNLLNRLEAAEKRVDAAEAALKRVTALVPGWYAEPSDCDPAHRCNEKVGCGASSCFAQDVMIAVYGDIEENWPPIAALNGTEGER
jgi:hypothetical protein